MKTSSTRTGINRAARRSDEGRPSRAATIHELPVLVVLVVVAALYATLVGVAKADPYHLHHDYYCLIQKEKTGYCADRSGRSLDGLRWLLTSGRRFEPGAHIVPQQDAAFALSRTGGRSPLAAKPVARNSSDWSGMGVIAGAALALLAICAGLLFRQRRAQARPA